MVEVNSMSNQWLVVYVDDKPAGFARITSKGERPKAIAQKRIIRIADFGIIEAYTDPAVRQSLFDKCLSICKSYEVIWINEYSENPLINFFVPHFSARQMVKHRRGFCNGYNSTDTAPDKRVPYLQAPHSFAQRRINPSAIPAGKCGY